MVWNDKTSTVHGTCLWVHTQACLFLYIHFHSPLTVIIAFLRYRIALDILQKEIAAVFRGKWHAEVEQSVCCCRVNTAAIIHSAT